MNTKLMVGDDVRSLTLAGEKLETPYVVTYHLNILSHES